VLAKKTDGAARARVESIEARRDRIARRAARWT
jgi:hypothetical protein